MLVSGNVNQLFLCLVVKEIFPVRFWERVVDIIYGTGDILRRLRCQLNGGDPFFYNGVQNSSRLRVGV